MKDLKYDINKNLYIGIPLNLAFFNDTGGEKTEKATPRKREKAREEGQVLKSQEISVAVLLLAVFGGLRIFGPYIYRNISEFMVTGLGMVAQTDFEITGNTLTRFVTQTFLLVIMTGLPMFMIVMVSMIIVNLIQVRWKPTAKPLMPKLSKLSPIKGFKKIFSMRALVELVKSLLKITIITLVILLMVRSEQDRLPTLLFMDLYQILSFIGNFVCTIGMMVGAMYLFIAGLDFLYQWWKHEKDLKMTKQEVKDEWKQTEGNPQIKGAIRRRMREVSMRRMMQAVPGADVIITNPTHYAVALKYDKKLGEAPVVVAKGVDFAARRIRESAMLNGVGIIENKPLARTLYDTVEVNHEIPPELYQAVAEIFAHLVNINKVAV
ncbi:MAG: flagellar biosynthesis protein FlhB [Defluviitaleaceae bacterium]|nr:flagellar biosynthesis protein FlhB [Defluviitaleaceae bacterium]MCL2835850.1 flagellar biosynthesis protein FlhB [Defluviitaleaceae bacterium]